jgi:hypothetical protein
MERDLDDEMKTDQGAIENQEQVDGLEVPDPDITSSVLSTVDNTNKNEFEHACLYEAVRLLDAQSICQSTDDRVPDHKYKIRGLPGPKLQADHIWAIWFILSR